MAVETGCGASEADASEVVRAARGRGGRGAAPVTVGFGLRFTSSLRRDMLFRNTKIILMLCHSTLYVSMEQYILPVERG